MISNTGPMNFSWYKLQHHSQLLHMWLCIYVTVHLLTWGMATCRQHRNPVTMWNQQQRQVVSATASYRHVDLFISQQQSMSTRGLWWPTYDMDHRHTCYTAKHCSDSLIYYVIGFVWVMSPSLDCEVEQSLMDWSPVSLRSRSVDLVFARAAEIND